jgi:cysteine desulfuration protein SufE
MDNKSIEETEAEIIEAFSWFENWEEKYEYIIELGKKLPVLDEKYKKEENIIKGCQSTVWLVAAYKDDKVFYQADSDAIIVKGLVSMLISVMSGHTPDEILDAKLDFIKEIGMMSHLAQTRSNGLVAMVKQIKNYALAFKTVNAKEKTLQ